MKYFASYNENNKLISIGMSNSSCGTEITKEQYDAYLAEIRERAELVNKLYAKEISIDDIPAEWQEEIQACVNDIIERKNTYVEQGISANEFYSMVEAVM